MKCLASLLAGLMLGGKKKAVWQFSSGTFNSRVGIRNYRIIGSQRPKAEAALKAEPEGAPNENGNGTL